MRHEREPDHRHRGATHECLAVLRVKLAELQSLEAGLAAFVCSCETECAGGPAADCAILDDLARPAGQALLAPPADCSGPGAG